MDEKTYEILTSDGIQITGIPKSIEQGSDEYYTVMRPLVAKLRAAGVKQGQFPTAAKPAPAAPQAGAPVPPAAAGGQPGEGQPAAAAPASPAPGVDLAAFPALARSGAPLTGQDPGKTDILDLLVAAARGGSPYAVAALGGAALGSVVPGAGTLVGAGVSTGAAAITFGVGDPLVTLANKTFGTQWQTPTEALNDLLNRLGVPESDTEAERIVEATFRAGGAAAGDVLTGKALYTVGAKGAQLAQFGGAALMRGIGQTMAQNPVSQLAGGAAAGAASQGAAELGAGPIPQFAAGIAGGLVGSRLVPGDVSMTRTPAPKAQTAEQASKEMGALIKRASKPGLGRAAARQKVIALAEINPEARRAAERLGIEMPADVFADNPQVRAAAGLARSMAGSDLEGAWKASVANALDQADDVMRQYDATFAEGNVAPAVVSERVKDAVTKTREALSKEATDLYAEIEAAVPKQTPVKLDKLAATLEEIANEVGEDGLTPQEKRLRAMVKSARSSNPVSSKEQQTINGKLPESFSERGDGIYFHAGTTEGVKAKIDEYGMAYLDDGSLGYAPDVGDDTLDTPKIWRLKIKPDAKIVESHENFWSISWDQAVEQYQEGKAFPREEWGGVVEHFLKMNDGDVEAAGEAFVEALNIDELGNVSAWDTGPIAGLAYHLADYPDVIKFPRGALLFNMDVVEAQQNAASYQNAIRELKKSPSAPSSSQGASSPPTYGRLLREKNLIGQALARKESPYGNMEAASLKRLYGALAEDQIANVDAAGAGGLGEKLHAANILYGKAKDLGDRIVDMYGSDVDGSISSKMKSAIVSASKGDGQSFNRLLDFVPEDLRRETVATSLASVARNRKGEFGFAEYAQSYKGLRANPPVYARIVKEMGEGSDQVLRDLYEVSKRITDARAAVLTTGKANQALLEGMGAAKVESLFGKIFNSLLVRTGSTAAGAAVAGPTGAAIAGAVTSALTDAKPSALQAAGKMFASKEFQRLATAAATGNMPNLEQIRTVARSSAFVAFARAVKLPGATTQRELWILAALQSAGEE